jgi:hypothetical protein
MYLRLLPRIPDALCRAALVRKLTVKDPHKAYDSKVMSLSLDKPKRFSWILIERYVNSYLTIVDDLLGLRCDCAVFKTNHCVSYFDYATRRFVSYDVPNKEESKYVTTKNVTIEGLVDVTFTFPETKTVKVVQFVLCTTPLPADSRQADHDNMTQCYYRVPAPLLPGEDPLRRLHKQEYRNFKTSESEWYLSHPDQLEDCIKEILQLNVPNMDEIIGSFDFVTCQVYLGDLDRNQQQLAVPSRVFKLADQSAQYDDYSRAIAEWRAAGRKTQLHLPISFAQRVFDLLNILEVETNPVISPANQLQRFIIPFEDVEPSVVRSYAQRLASCKGRALKYMVLKGFQFKQGQLERLLSVDAASVRAHRWGKAEQMSLGRGHYYIMTHDADSNPRTAAAVAANQYESDLDDDEL